MTLRRSPLVLATALLIASCYHGQRLSTFRPAHSGAGIEADIRLRKARIRGELLEVQDSALVVLTTDGKMTLIRFDDIRVGTFGQKGALIGAASKLPVTELRNLSRYPAGLTPELRGRLLSAYGQTEMEVAR